MDPYKLLGVTPGADAQQLRKAFREKARLYHPDLNSDPDAAEKFKEIQNAYQQLCDSEQASTLTLDQVLQDLLSKPTRRKIRVRVSPQAAEQGAKIRLVVDKKPLIIKLQPGSKAGDKYLVGDQLLVELIN